MFGELFLYFYRNRNRFSDWQAVVIYPSRVTEQSQIQPYRALLESNRVHRVYLDTLGELNQLPLGVALMALTTVNETAAPEVARELLTRSHQETLSEIARRTIMDMVTTIMVYKFTSLSRQEIEAMLGLTTIQETRVYQEAKAEGEKKGIERERSLILRQLTRKVGDIPQDLRSRIDQLPLTQLESLGEALLDFSMRQDLIAWLECDQAED